MGVDIFWYAVRYSDLNASEEVLTREVQARKSASSKELRDISDRFSLPLPVFEGDCPTAFGYVETYFPTWSFAASGRKDHDLRGKHAAIAAVWTQELPGQHFNEVVIGDTRERELDSE
jgi:hypothetical protein